MYFGQFLDFRGILVVLKFQGYFSQFLGLGGILVVLEVFFFWEGYFAHFRDFGSIFGHFSHF